jgi:hypothetical protein
MAYSSLGLGECSYPTLACYIDRMVPLKAVVKNGRIIVDAPTDLPDGTELELVAADDLDEPERAALVAAVEQGFEDFERGDHVDGFELLAELKARREAASR